MNDALETPFHDGELELQERAGWRDRLAKGRESLGRSARRQAGIHEHAG
jgi:hypothetical protein